MHNRETTDKYGDIINLPHHVSVNRAHISMQDRAAQFSPFAALTGYEAVLKEASRLTSEKIELDENALELLDKRLSLILDKCHEHPTVTLTYFKPDERKDGGEYMKVTGILKKSDMYKQELILSDGTTVPISEIAAIESDIIPNTYDIETASRE